MPISEPYMNVSRIYAGAGALDRIADLLGTPVEAFTNPAYAPQELRDTLELLELWGRMDSDADRERLLTYGRSLL